MNMLPYSGFPALPDKTEDMHAQLVALGLNDVEALTARIKKCEDWVDAVEETELTGNPVVFQNALAVPAASLEATIEPIQDLHGYDHPWAGGAGKNKFDVDSVTAMGSAVVTKSGTKVSVSGNATYLSFSSSHYVLKANVTYTVSCHIKPITIATGWTPCITIRNTSNQILELVYTSVETDTSFSYTPTEDVEVYVSGVISGATASAAECEFSNIQLEEGSSATSYEPYSNICPISGRTETSVTTTNEDESESSSVTIQLGQTVYGGQVDFKTGRVRVTKARKVFNGSEAGWYKSSVTACDIFYMVDNGMYLGNDTLLSMYPFFNQTNYNQVGSAWYDGTHNQLRIGFSAYGTTDLTAFKTWLASNNLQVCYELATPTELTLTPAQLQMLKGYNSVSSDDASSLTVTAYTGGPWEPITRAIKKVTNKTKTTKKRRK